MRRKEKFVNHHFISLISHSQSKNFTHKKPDKMKLSAQSEFVAKRDTEFFSKRNSFAQN